MIKLPDTLDSFGTLNSPILKAFKFSKLCKFSSETEKFVKAFLDVLKLPIIETDRLTSVSPTLFDTSMVPTFSNKEALKVVKFGTRTFDTMKSLTVARTRKVIDSDGESPVRFSEPVMDLSAPNVMLPGNWACDRSRSSAIVVRAKLSGETPEFGDTSKEMVPLNDVQSKNGSVANVPGCTITASSVHMSIRSMSVGIQKLSRGTGIDAVKI